MSFIIALLRDLAVGIPVVLVCSVATALLLWRFRSWGLWALVLGFGLEIVFIALGFVVAPGAMLYHNQSSPPLPMGITLGCTLPLVSVVLRHLRQSR